MIQYFRDVRAFNAEVRGTLVEASESSEEVSKIIQVGAGIGATVLLSLGGYLAQHTVEQGIGYTRQLAETHRATLGETAETAIKLGLGIPVEAGLLYSGIEAAISSQAVYRRRQEMQQQAGEEAQGDV